MGRPYSKELKQLGSTASWAHQVDISRLVSFVQESADLPLIAVGSGGSSTAAHFAALLHRERHRQFARHATPLELLTNEPGLGDAAVLVASASGRNRDVLAALRTCIQAEVPALATITTRRPSPLAQSASAYSRSRVAEFSLPAGKDGYLATNSLLATMLVLARAYGFDPRVRVSDIESALPGDLVRRTVLVLHGGWASPVATDLESKLNESALAGALLADYRNFGHGRHLWLAKRSAETLVVALSTPDVSDLAGRTLALLPPATATLRLTSDHCGPAGTLDLLVQALLFVGALGRASGVDPGKPKVPSFGRKMYALPAGVAPPGITPVDRKHRRAPVRDQRTRAVLEVGHTAFLQRLRAAHIGAVAFDFDGTLSADRTKPVSDEVGRELARLARAGILVGLATGRGDSARTELRNALPKTAWKNVLVGYHNASEIGALDDDSVPRAATGSSSSLAELARRLRQDSVLRDLAEISESVDQLSIRPKTGLRLRPLSLMSHVLSLASDFARVYVVTSTHSVDVVTPGTSKLAVVRALKDRLRPPADVLSIGDRGAWPGNDFELLSGALTLSVDEPSTVADRCWNLAPPGVIGPEASAFYLNRLRVKNRVGRFNTKGLG